MSTKHPYSFSFNNYKTPCGLVMNIVVVDVVVNVIVVDVVGVGSGSGSRTVRTAVDIRGPLLAAKTKLFSGCSLGTNVLGLVLGVNTRVVQVVVKVAEQNVQRCRQDCSKQRSMLCSGRLGGWYERVRRGDNFFWYKPLSHMRGFGNDDKKISSRRVSQFLLHEYFLLSNPPPQNDKTKERTQASRSSGHE